MTSEGVGEGRWRRRVDPRRRTSVSTRLAIAVLLVAVVTIVTTVIVSSSAVSETTDDLISEGVDTRARAAVADLRVYFTSLTRGLEFLAASPAFAEAAASFDEAFLEIASSSPGSFDADEEAVATFYVDTFLNDLAAVRGEPVDPFAFVPSDEAVATFLQAQYIARNPFDGTERRLLTDPGDDTAWTALHERAHPPLRELADRLGLDDLMLVSPRSEAIVYAVNKDVAFATDLVSGPHSGTSLAGLVRRVLADPSAGTVVAADVAVYPPALDRPTAFLATPVYRDGTLVSVLVGSVSFDEVTRVMTESWREGRWGDTGEMYLVGRDRRMRSDARLLLEDPPAYFAAVDEAGSVTGIDRNRMQALDTSVIFQTVDTEAVDAALNGDTGTLRGANYLGQDVVSSVREIGGAFDWLLVVEQGIDEVEGPLNDYIRSTLVITVVFVVFLTFLAVAWSGRFMAPVRGMSAALARIRSGSDTTDVPIAGAAEFRALGRQLDTMVQALRGRRAAVLDALRSKAAVTRTLMPPSAAMKVSHGERHLVESIPQASVVAVVLDGVDDLVSTPDTTESRDLLHALIDRLDELAAASGLERVAVAGDSYLAVCGLSSPRIDHAPRSAAFATAAVGAVEAVGGAAGTSLGARIGIASGTVAAGLVGDTGLVFDIWGQPVDTARALAHAATPGVILVDRAARDRMPSSVVLSAVDTAAGEAWSYVAADAEAGER